MWWSDDPPQYHPPWPRHFGSSRFLQMITRIKTDDRVLDLGCSAGLFAAYCWHQIKNPYYVGVDACEEGIVAARRCNAELGGHPHARFELEDLETVSVGKLIEEYYPDVPLSPLLTNQILVVCAETLEHLRADEHLVESIPQGLRCLVTLPRFDCEGHLRWFTSPEQVAERYGRFFGGYESLLSNTTWIGSRWRRRDRWCLLFYATRKDAS